MNTSRRKIEIERKTLDELVIAPIKVINDLVSPIYELDEEQSNYIVQRYLPKCVKNKKPCQGTVKPFIFRQSDSATLSQDKNVMNGVSDSNIKISLTQALEKEQKKYQKNVIEKDIKKLEKQEKEEEKDFINDSSFKYNLNCRYEILGSNADHENFTEFFSHIVREFTQNAFKNYYSIQQKELELLTPIYQDAAIPIDISDESRPPLPLNGKTEDFNLIKKVLKNYTIDLKTYEDSENCYISCTNSAILTPKEEIDLLQTIQQNFSAEKDDDSTKAMQIVQNGKVWGGLGFIMMCSMLKKIDGYLTAFYEPDKHKLEFIAYLPKDKIHNIPSAE